MNDMISSLGPSTACYDLEHVREKGGFPSTEDGQLQAVATVIRRNILPLRAEYFHDEWRMIDFVFGKNWGTHKGGLLTSHSLEKLDEAADELLDLSDVSVYDLRVFEVNRGRDAVGYCA